MEPLSIVEAGGLTYEVARLDTFKQLHLARKIGPLMIPALPMLLKLWEAGEKPNMGALLKQIAVYLPDALTIFSLMDMEQADFIVFTCLDAVYRKTGTGSVKVRVQGNTMFNDIKLPDLFKLIYEVIKVNLGDFIDTGLPKGSAAETATQP